MIRVTMKPSVALLVFCSLFGLNISVYKLHYFVDENLSWQDARTHCRQHYHDLSMVREKDLLVLLGNPLLWWENIWIGLWRDGVNAEKWIWSDNTEATITFWDYEADDSSKKCGAINTFMARKDNCDNKLRFYCMTVFELIVVHQESTWEEALEFCRVNYIDLATINYDDIMDEAKNKSARADTDELWIGLRFLAGQWFWVNREPLGYEYWPWGKRPQCPAMNQRCGVYNRTENAWGTADCEKRLNFLCVKKANF